MDFDTTGEGRRQRLADRAQLGELWAVPERVDPLVNLLGILINPDGLGW